MLQPGRQFVERRFVTASKDFNIAATEIDGVAFDIQRFCDATCAVAKKHALNTAFDRESASTGHRGFYSVKVILMEYQDLKDVFPAACAALQCFKRFHLGLFGVVAREFVLALVEVVLGTLQVIDGRLEGISCQFSRACLLGYRYRLSRIAHFLYGRRLATDDDQQCRKQCTSQDV